MIDVINVIVALKKKSSRQTILRTFRSIPIFKVEVCLNEHELKSLLTKRNVDFLIVEYGLAEGGIFRFIEANRTLEWSLMELILCTEENDPELRSKAKDYNFSGFLKIPFSGLEIKKELEPLVLSLSETQSEKQNKLATDKLVRSKKYKEACEYFSKIPLEKMNLDTTFKYATCLGRISKEEKGIELLQNILKSSPEHVQAMDLLSQLLMKAKKYKKAYSYAKKSISLASDNPERLLLVTELAVRSTNFSDVMTYANLVDQYKWNHHQVMVYVVSGLIIQGMNLINKNANEEAFKCFFKAAELAQVSPELKHLMQRALIEASLVKIDEDLNFLIAEAYPDRDHPGFLFIQGMKNFHQKTFESAIVYFKKVCDEDQLSQFALPMLMDSYLANGEVDQAKKLVTFTRVNANDAITLSKMEKKLKAA